MPSGIGNDDRVVGEIEQLGVAQQFLSHLLQIAFRFRLLHETTDGRSELGQAFFKNEVRRARLQRFVDGTGVIRIRDEDHRDLRTLLPRDRERAQPVALRGVTIGQNNIDRLL